VTVAYACNLSYSGGRNQEDHSSKLFWAKFARPFLEKPYHKKIGLVEWLKVKAPVPQKIKKKQIWAGHWWLMPVLLATQEGEIRRITA
jgi:hypothetical protein